ncbi:MAG: hypothetical protein HFI93_05875 [Lachnospiraceae bacterium]|nr:hypothetical protein [Lachnospiraceae bacterium]
MKKQNRLLGTESFYSSRTGELVEMQLVETNVYEKDSNFHKVFLKDFIQALNSVADSKTRLCYWLLSHMTRDNRILYTYREISRQTGISYATVADTMKKLLGMDFIRRNSSGQYMVNPTIIFKGTYQRRCMAVAEFHKAAPDESDLRDELRLQDIRQNISRLQKQEKRIQKNLARANANQAAQTDEPVKTSEEPK